MQIQLFENIYLENKARLRRYCLYLTNNNFADAEDLVEESFMRFYIKFFADQQTADEGASSFPNNVTLYLKGIARHTAWEQWRKHQGFKYMESINESHDAQQKSGNDNLDSKIDVSQVKQLCCQILTPLDRSIFNAFYFGKCSQNEISQMFSVSVRTVKHRLDRARRKLQNIFITTNSNE